MDIVQCHDAAEVCVEDLDERRLETVFRQLPESRRQPQRVARQLPDVQVLAHGGHDVAPVARHRRQTSSRRQARFPRNVAHAFRQAQFPRRRNSEQTTEVLALDLPDAMTGGYGADEQLVVWRQSQRVDGAACAAD